MTIYDYIAISALIAAIGINCSSVHIQRTRKFYDRFGANALRIHGALITVFWGIFIVTEFLLVHSTWRLLDAHPVTGLLIMAIALAIFILAIKQIGYQALANGNFFGYPIRKLEGIYRYVRDPIYWSYVLWFTGLGFLTAQKGFFVIALIAVVGLTGIESRIERVL